MDEQKQTFTEINEHLVKIYEQICTNIRVSDDISFKLLGFVPLISGSGAAILTLSQIWVTSSVAILLISILASIITFGLFKWEMRNVQKCDWLIMRAVELERSNFRVEALGEKHVVSQFYGWSLQEKPPLFGKIPEFQPMNKDQPSSKGVGKEEAERIIYWASIAAWFIPVLTAFIK